MRALQPIASPSAPQLIRVALYLIRLDPDYLDSRSVRRAVLTTAAALLRRARRGA